jgi:hypothetical protein
MNLLHPNTVRLPLNSDVMDVNGNPVVGQDAAIAPVDFITHVGGKGVIGTIVLP